ncbi:hypothetical protein ACQ4PT_029153 [Festuca glaucescens]
MMQSHMTSPARLGMTVSSPSLPPNQSPVNPASSPPQSNSSSSAAAVTSGAAAPTPNHLGVTAAALAAAPAGSVAAPPHVLPRLQPLRDITQPRRLDLILPGIAPQLPRVVVGFHGASGLHHQGGNVDAHLAQTQLFETVAELKETLDLQDARARRAREARAKDAALHAFAKKLREGPPRARSPRRRLCQTTATMPSAHAVPLRSTCQPRSSERPSTPSSSCDDILTYAHRISYTTFAPPEHGAGLPLRGALPPAPQDNEMRMSQLYQFADLDVGVPKKLMESKEGGTSETDSAPLFVPPPEEPRPSMLPITVPAGWPKGLPKDLLPDIPAPPPGWKPGDPIELLLVGFCLVLSLRNHGQFGCNQWCQGTKVSQ